MSVTQLYIHHLFLLLLPPLPQMSFITAIQCQMDSENVKDDVNQESQYICKLKREYSQSVKMLLFETCVTFTLDELNSIIYHIYLCCDETVS